MTRPNPGDYARAKYAVDQGTAFGTWDDPTSRLIYHDAMPALLSGVMTHGKVLDLGGANGLARTYFPGLLTVDLDESKHPDVVADMLTYTPGIPHDLVLLRYVTHYLRDYEVRHLLWHIASYHDGPVLLIQFVNDDLRAKEANSIGERKWFRSESMLRSLLKPYRIQRRIAVSYDVHPDFYRNRLNHPSPTGHPETVVSYLLVR